MKTKITLLIFLIISAFSSSYACDQSVSTLTGYVQNGNGTYTLTFQVCFAGSNANQGDSHGFYITVNGANIVSVSPTSITNSTTVSSSISGGTATWGPWNNNGSACFVCTDDARVCYNVNVTTDVLPSGWTVGGQEYVPASFPFSAAWCEYTGTIPLSIKIQSFYSRKTEQSNILYWVAEEQNNKHFIVERSVDLVNWEQISTVDGRGTSNQAALYSLEDKNFSDGTNYYRVKDVDFNGSTSTSFAIAVDNKRKKDSNLVNTYNFMGVLVDSSYKGYVIEVYSDGSTIKRFRD